jgi:hypothetical protein
VSFSVEKRIEGFGGSAHAAALALALTPDDFDAIAHRYMATLE